MHVDTGVIRASVYQHISFQDAGQRLHQQLLSCSLQLRECVTMNAFKSRLSSSRQHIHMFRIYSSIYTML